MQVFDQTGALVDADTALDKMQYRVFDRDPIPRQQIDPDNKPADVRVTVTFKLASWRVPQAVSSAYKTFGKEPVHFQAGPHCAVFLGPGAMFPGAPCS